MTAIIERKRSIIPACDIEFKRFVELLKATSDLEVVQAHKLGIAAIGDGLNTWVQAVKDYTGARTIYDHQKAATDIHEMTPQRFMDVMVKAKVDAVILFPQSGPVSQYEWIRAAQERNLGVIVGGEMTHPRFLDGDLGEGKKNYTEIFRQLGIERPLPGYIRASAPEDIYELAARMGVTHFVVPGNKPERIKIYKSLVERCGVINPVLFSPGLVKQGGSITEGGKAAGEFWHAIVGRDVYEKEDMRAAVLEHASQLAA
ncbi:MAG: hypothetical protein Q8L34_02715 [Candidatus Woesearchaeota archaeon]|nr:hypothetical protein [Candidatus Woesearchaeota archaeon]